MNDKLKDAKLKVAKKSVSNKLEELPNKIASMQEQTREKIRQQQEYLNRFNEEGYFDTGKKYGDYFYENYEQYKDLPIYEKDNKFYLYSNNNYQDLGKLDTNGNIITGNVMTSKDVENEKLERAKALGYKEDTSGNITSKEYDKAQKVFEDLKKQYKLSDEELEDFKKTGNISLKNISIVTNSMESKKDEALHYLDKINKGEIKQYSMQLTPSEKLFLETSNMTDSQKESYINFLAGKQSTIARDNSTYFKTSNLWDDGWQPGDILNTLTGTLLTAGADIVAGIGSRIENAADFLTNALATPVEVIAGQSGKKDITKNLNGNTVTKYQWGDQTFWYDSKNNKLYDDSNKEIPYFNIQNLIKVQEYNNQIAELAKYVKNEVNSQNVMQDAILNNDFTNMFREASVFGEKTESLLESLGGTLPLMAVGMSGADAGTTAGIIFSTSYGASKADHIQMGETEDEAMLNAFIEASAETISEQFFEGIPGMKTANWGDNLVDALAKGGEEFFKSTKAGNIIRKLTPVLGEGFEEIISNSLTSAGKTYITNLFPEYNLTGDYIPQGVLENMLNELTSSDSWEQFAGAIITSAILNGGSAIIDAKVKNEIIDAYASDNNITFDEAKEELNLIETGTEYKEATIENGTGDTIRFNGNELNSHDINDKVLRLISLSETISDESSLNKISNAINQLTDANEMLKTQLKDIEELKEKQLTEKTIKKPTDSETLFNRYQPNINEMSDDFDYNKSTASHDTGFGLSFTTSDKYIKDKEKTDFIQTRLQSEKGFLYNNNEIFKEQDIKALNDVMAKYMPDMPPIFTEGMTNAEVIDAINKASNFVANANDNQTGRNAWINMYKVIDKDGYIKEYDNGEKEASVVSIKNLKDFKPKKENSLKIENKDIQTKIKDLTKEISAKETMLDLLPDNARDAAIEKINKLIDERTALEEQLSEDEIGADIEYDDSDLEDAPIKIDQSDYVDVLTEMPVEDKTIKEKLQEEFKETGTTLDKAMTNFITSWWPFEKLARKSENKNLLPLLNNLFSADTQAQSDLKYAQRDLEGNIVGKSLNEIFKPIEADEHTYEFGIYMYLSRQATKAEGTADVFGKNITSEDAKELVRDMEKEFPEFKKYKQDILQYEKNLRNIMVDSGLISQKLSDYLEELYPEYVRIYRDVYKNKSPFIREGGKLKVVSPVKQATGGTQNLIPLKEALGRQTLEVKKAAARNMFGQELYNILGGTQTSYKDTDIKDNLMQFRDKNYGYVFYKNGKQTTVPMNETMKNALDNGTYNKLGLGSKVIQKLSSAQRSLITNLNPFFAITNMPKDFFDAVINTEHPATFLLNYPKAWGLMLSNSDVWKTYLALGAKDVSIFDYNKGFTEDSKIKKILKSPLKLMEFIGEHSEQVTRFTEYLNTLSQGGSQFEAMYNAAEVTVNFKKGGKYTKQLGRYGFNYLNASILGAYKAYENIANKKGGKAFIKYAVQMAALSILPAIANSMMYGDDDDYEALSDDIKYKNYVFKIGDHTFLKIPKGRLSSIISNVPQKLVEGKDITLTDYLGFTLDQIGPNNPIESNLYYPLYNVIKNGNNAKNYFGSSIVPTRYKNKTLEDQQNDPKVTSFAKKLSEITGISPFLIDYLYDSYTGFIGDVTIPLMTEQADKNIFEAKFIVDSITNNQNVNDLYDLEEQYTYPKTEDDLIRYKYLNSKSLSASDYYTQIRKVQADKSLSDSEKKEQINKLRTELNDFAKEAVETIKKEEVKNKTVDGVQYKQIGPDYLYKYNKDEKKWEKVNVRSKEYKNTID